MAPKRTLDDAKENPNSKRAKTLTALSTMGDVLHKVKNMTTEALKQLYIALHNATTGYQALCYASKNGHLEVVKELLKYNPDLSVNDRYFRKDPLSIASA